MLKNLLTHIQIFKLVSNQFDKILSLILSGTMENGVGRELRKLCHAYLSNREGLSPFNISKYNPNSGAQWEIYNYVCQTMPVLCSSLQLFCDLLNLPSCYYRYIIA